MSAGGLHASAAASAAVAGRGLLRRVLVIGDVVTGENKARARKA